MTSTRTAARTGQAALRNHSSHACPVHERIDVLVREGEGDGESDVLITCKDCHRALALDDSAIGVTPVGQLMSAPGVLIGEDATLDAVGLALLTADAEGAPVIDEVGRPVGYIALAHLASQPGTGVRRARDVMRPYPWVLGVDEPIARAASWMAAHGVRQIVVAGARGEAVGVVTASNLLSWLETNHTSFTPAYVGRSSQARKTPAVRPPRRVERKRTR